MQELPMAVPMQVMLPCFQEGVAQDSAYMLLQFPAQPAIGPAGANPGAGVGVGFSTASLESTGVAGVYSIAPAQAYALPMMQPADDYWNAVWPADVAAHGGAAGRCAFASSATVQRRLRRQRAARVSREAATNSQGRFVRLSALAGRPAHADDSEVEALSAVQRRLESGDASQRAAALQELWGSVLRWAFHPVGCRVVQSALELCSMDEAASLAAELHGHVREACEDKHGNFVVAKIVEVLPTEHSAFVAQELKLFADVGVRHRFCCRIFCRLIEHASTHPDAAALIEEAVARRAGELSRNEFAHFVVAHVMEHGLPQHRAIAASSVMESDFACTAQHRHGRFVVEALILHGALEDQVAAIDLLRSQADLVALSLHEFGYTAVAASVKSKARPGLVEQLSASAAVLQGNKYGQRVLQAVERQRNSPRLGATPSV